MTYGTYLLLSLIGLVFSLGASFFTSFMFNKYKHAPASRDVTPEDLAREVIEGESLRVSLEHSTYGDLSDHYDPFRNVVRLSASTSRVSGISQLAVTAHELGHALQDKYNGILFKFRNILAGIVGFTTNIGYFLFIVGLFLSIFDLAYVGLILFSTTTLFMFITLPIELDASRRAMQLLRKYNVLSADELGPAQGLLTAAALTYIAGFLQSFIQLLYFMSLLSGRRRNE